MKISKILAGMSAMALAASMMTMGASAEISNANFNDGKDYCFDVFAAVGAEKAATISSVRAKLSFKNIDDLKANGAGGGFITSSDGNNWKSTEFGNDGADKPITFVVDEASSTATMEKTLTDADKFTGSGEDALSYAQVVFQSWWGEFSVDNVACYDAAGELVCSVTGDGIDLYKAPEKGGNEVDLSAYDATEVTLAGNGEAKVDTGKVRVNVNNPWGEDVDKLITPADFEGVDAIAVTAEFDAITDPVDFAINFAIFSDNGPQYWGEGNAANKGCSTEAVTVNADGSYTFLLKFDEPLTVDGDLFLDLQSAFEAATDDDIPFAAKVTSVKALTLKDAPAPSESTADSTESTDSDESKVILTDSSDSKTNSAATSSKAANNASNTNPSTGAAALAAVGVALAGAAVVATKKRK
mgnify:CR=1 FL=1